MAKAKIPKAKIPKECIKFKIALYALKQYKSWTDEDVAKRIGVSSRTVRRMREDPFGTSSANVLKIQSLAAEAEANY